MEDKGLGREAEEVVCGLRRGARRAAEAAEAVAVERHAGAEMRTCAECARLLRTIRPIDMRERVCLADEREHCDLRCAMEHAVHEVCGWLFLERERASAILPFDTSESLEKGRRGPSADAKS